MESYQRLFDLIALEGLQMQAEHWVLTRVLVFDTIAQLCILAVVFLLSLGAAWRARTRLGQTAGWSPEGVFQRIGRSAPEALVAPGLALALVAVSIVGVSAAGGSSGLLWLSAQLLASWIVIWLFSRVFENASIARVVSAIAFALAALHVTDLLEPLIVFLDRINFALGTLSLSLLDVLRTAIQVTAFIWAALALARLLENGLQHVTNMTPSLQVLTGKLARAFLVTSALIIALTSAGIDLAAFAFFTGALGVGIGFGMRSVISNLISGLLLLMDRSIKPGDVIELSEPGTGELQLFGWVTALNARYVSITTRDGTEWLVPNDELISRRIVNWSFNHNRLRLLTPIIISFESDVRQAIDIAQAAMRSTPRVLDDPAPVCRLMGFEDSAVRLEMRFWIDDPTNGIINVRSDVLLRVWEAFREAGIRTQLAHRDLHLKPGSELNLRMQHGPPQGSPSPGEVEFAARP